MMETKGETKVGYVGKGATVHIGNNIYNFDIKKIEDLLLKFYDAIDKSSKDDFESSLNKIQVVGQNLADELLEKIKDSIQVCLRDVKENDISIQQALKDHGEALKKIEEVYETGCAILEQLKKGSPSPAADGETESKSDRRDPYYENDCCPRCGSYHSFDIYNEGKTEKDSYYICAVCGRRDDARDDTTIIKDDKRINPELHVLGASELDNPMNDHNLTSLKRVLVRDNIQKIGTSQSGSAINKYYGNLEIFSLSNPNKKGEPYYTLGKGLFDFSNNSEWIKLKLYGMKYVIEIDEGCFKGIKEEERQKFWDENGFKIPRDEKYFC